MRLLLACKSCAAHAHYDRMIRETWGKNVRDADLKFFKGRGSNPHVLYDVGLDCDDSYVGLPEKTWAILRWSVSNNYDYTFLFDTDTFVMPGRLLETKFREHDIYGLFNGEVGKPCVSDGMWAWVSGGVGYWLSRRAAELVVKNPPTHWAEDCSVGQALGPALASGGMRGATDGNYGWHHDHEPYRCSVTKHYCAQGYRRAFDVQWMAAHYRYNVLGR